MQFFQKLSSAVLSIVLSSGVMLSAGCTSKGTLTPFGTSVVTAGAAGAAVGQLTGHNTSSTLLGLGIGMLGGAMYSFWEDERNRVYVTEDARLLNYFTEARQKLYRDQYSQYQLTDNPKWVLEQNPASYETVQLSAFAEKAVPQPKEFPNGDLSVKNGPVFRVDPSKFATNVADLCNINYCRLIPVYWQTGMYECVCH